MDDKSQNQLKNFINHIQYDSYSEVSMLTDNFSPQILFLKPNASFKKKLLWPALHLDNKVKLRSQLIADTHAATS